MEIVDENDSIFTCCQGDICIVSTCRNTFWIYQASKMDAFVRIVNVFKLMLLTIFAKVSL